MECSTRTVLDACRCVAVIMRLLRQYRYVMLHVLLWTGMVYRSVADPVITHPPQSTAREVGGTVQFDCTINETYQYYFDWIRDRDRLIYFMVNTGFMWGSGFPAEQFHRVGLYGFSITSLTLLDGANYRCGFTYNNLYADANLFVIGKFSN